jgi:Kef-type K+ transport system membrane component KefB
MRKNLLIYLSLIAVFCLGIYAVLVLGSRFAVGDGPPDPIGGPATENAPSVPLGTNHTAPNSEARVQPGRFQDPLTLLLIQVIVIIAAARGLGILFTRMGQPAVIGEMIAGILLGPSLLGWLAPRAEAFLFPPSSLGALQLLSQIGVILFMFIVGMELNVHSLRQSAHAAVLISHAGIIVPFLLGSTLSVFLYQSLAPPNASFLSFALFMGIAMSITAFPVLARIIEQRGLTKTSLGSTVIACAAVDDVTAWCLLALVVAIAGAGGITGAVLTIGLALAFTAAMLFVIKPRLPQFMARFRHEGSDHAGTIAVVFIFTFASALFTEAIGIHALFGAFLAGVVLPSPEVLGVPVRERLESFATVFLLPLFFAFTGLRTQVGLLDDWQSWLICAVIIGVAIAGKLGGTSAAARAIGMSWHDSLSIGALMNTRGLMELIALNIGYELGILSAKVFSMMVIMALTTTIMTGPILSFLEARKGAQAPSVPERGPTPGQTGI